MLRAIPAFTVVLLLFQFCMARDVAFNARTELSRPNIHPAAIVASPDGSLWFTEDRGIEHFAAGRFRLFPIPGLRAPFDQNVPSSLAIDKIGQIWFASGQRIGRIDVRGVLTLFGVPKSQGYPTVFSDPRAQVWRMLVLDAGHTSRIAFARLAPDGRVLPGFVLHAASVLGVAVARNGRFWFAETRITNSTPGSGPMYGGWVTPDGRSTRYPLPRSIAGICNPTDCLLSDAGIAAAGDGSMWYGYYGPALGRVLPTGHVDIFRLSASTLAPTTLVEGPDGNIWLGTIGVGIERVDRTGQDALFLVSDRIDIYGGIAAGKDRALWFTMSCQNSIGRITLSGRVTRDHIPGTAVDAGERCPVLP